jgi:hypothetical protein
VIDERSKKKSEDVREGGIEEKKKGTVYEGVHGLTIVVSRGAIFVTVTYYCDEES